MWQYTYWSVLIHNDVVNEKEYKYYQFCLNWRLHVYFYFINISPILRLLDSSASEPIIHLWLDERSMNQKKVLNIFRFFFFIYEKLIEDS